MQLSTVPLCINIYCTTVNRRTPSAPPLFSLLWRKFFYGHIWAFLTPPRPLYGPSRPQDFHGPSTFFTATFEQKGRRHGPLATLLKVSKSINQYLSTCIDKKYFDFKVKNYQWACVNICCLVRDKGKLCLLYTITQKIPPNSLECVL